jgi:hypothetical protein
MKREFEALDCGSSLPLSYPRGCSRVLSLYIFLMTKADTGKSGCVTVAQPLLAVHLRGQGFSRRSKCTNSRPASLLAGYQIEKASIA